MNELNQLLAELRIGARLLYRELGDPWGHVTVRLPESDGRQGFLLKYVRVPPPPADPEAAMIFDYDGQRLEGQGKAPWEVPLYTNIFKARPDVRSIVHSHPHVANAISMAGRTVFAITHQSAQFGHGVPVFPGDMINTDELGTALARTLGAAAAVLLKGHGAVAVGLSVPQAVQTMLGLEQAARQQVWAATVGTPEVLEDRLIDFFKKPPSDIEALAFWHTRLYYNKEA